MGENSGVEHSNSPQRRMRECSRSATLGPWLLGGQAVTRPVRAGVGPLALFTQRVVRQLHYLVKTFLVGQSQMIFVEDWDVGAGGE